MAAISAGLLAAALLAYLPALGAGFVDFDDLHLVAENPRVLAGLRPSSLAWAFTTQHGGNYVPVAWLSHLTDVTLFGRWAPGHHATSIALHALGSVLLFRVLHQMTGAVWRSALAAALFALHPLRVESVAWISERRDVLSLPLAMLSLGAWVRYTRSRADWPRYGAACGFALTLLAKPTWVTFPFLLMLLDRWPLGRASLRSPLLREKIPFFGLTLLACLWTLAAQAGHVAAVESVPLPYRVANALLSYWVYLWQTFWPEGLGVLYLYPERIEAWQVGAAAVALAAVSALAIWQRARRPWLLTGWLWYLGAMVPMLGLVQVGAQAHADRYTYVPAIGLCWALAWSLPAAWFATPLRRRVAGTATLGVLAALGIATAAQCRHWRDGVALFERALAVSPRNFLAERYLGLALAREGRLQQALGHLDASLALNPRHPPTHYDRALTLADLGRASEAMDALEQALALDPRHADAHNALATRLAEAGRADEAWPHFEAAIRLRPDHAGFRRNLGLALARAGESARAEAVLEEALRLDPGSADAHVWLGTLRGARGDLAGAIGAFESALAIDPGHAPARSGLERARRARKGP